MPRVHIDAAKLHAVHQGHQIAPDEAALCFTVRLRHLGGANSTRRGRGGTLLKKRGLRDPVRIASQDQRAILEIRQQLRRDIGVIAQRVTFGFSCLGEVHLVEVGHMQRRVPHHKVAVAPCTLDAGEGGSRRLTTFVSPTFCSLL